MSDIITQDNFKELLLDFNMNFLLDLHEQLIDKYIFLGIMQKSKSTDFIHCIMSSINLVYQENTKPIEDDTFY